MINDDILVSLRLKPRGGEELGFPREQSAPSDSNTGFTKGMWYHLFLGDAGE